MEDPIICKISIDDEIYLSLQPYLNEIVSSDIHDPDTSLSNLGSFIEGLDKPKPLLYKYFWCLLCDAYILYHFEDKVDIEIYNIIKKMAKINNRIARYAIEKEFHNLCETSDYLDEMVRIVLGIKDIHNKLLGKKFELILPNIIPIKQIVDSEEFGDGPEYFFDLVVYLEADLNVESDFLMNIFENIHSFIDYDTYNDSDITEDSNEISEPENPSED